MRRALRKAEKELEDRQNAPLAELQQWLQVTYEIESKHYDAKREAVERHLVDAKDMVNSHFRLQFAFIHVHFPFNMSTQNTVKALIRDRMYN